MKYYVGQLGDLFRVGSFDGSPAEDLTFEEAMELKESGDLIGLYYGGDRTTDEREFVSKHSNYTVPEDNVDVHYIKNSILNCSLDLCRRLNKFGIILRFDTATTDLSFLTYRLSFMHNINMASVITYLHEIGLVNFDLLEYRIKPESGQLAYLRIKLSPKYTDAIINNVVQLMLEESTNNYCISESYTGLILDLSAHDAHNYWSMLKERYEAKKNEVSRFYV